MPLICWDKPKKLRSTWNGKVTHITTSPQVEIRKDSLVVIVGLKGYTYKYYKAGRKMLVPAKGPSTKNLNIHIAAAGALRMSFKTWEELIQVMAEARQVLEKLKLEQDLKKILTTKTKLGHSFNKKTRICVRCGMSSLYANFFKRPCS